MTSSDDRLFPEDFLWGAATAAYQVEGSPLADGAGPSHWHRFTHTPGRVANGDTGDVACDFYRRWESDVELMRELGLQAFRMSVAWGRVFPEGTGRVNVKGLDFYARLVDRLLERGITPSVTLYHWDLPAALDDRGGWLNPDIAHWFTDYAQTLFRALGDRVPLWSTLNEPWVIADAGYLHGVHAPGHASPWEAPRASHNLLRAHAAAVRAYRAGGWPHRIGLVVNLEPKYPASEAAADLAATRRSDAYMNRQYTDPVFLGRYPDEMPELYGEAWPRWDPAEVAALEEPIDFLGVNYYTRGIMRDEPSQPVERAVRVRHPGHPVTELGWEVYPEAFYQLLTGLKARYGDVPLYITENGAAFYDPPSTVDLVPDGLRIAYLTSHLRAVREAMRAGVDVRGYFVWSLFDNLEWSAGYAKRFGIVHVDFATQVRTPKASAAFYREVIRTRGAHVAP